MPKEKVTYKDIAESLKKQLGVDGTVNVLSDLETQVLPIGNTSAKITIRGAMFQVDDKKKGRSFIAILK